MISEAGSPDPSWQPTISNITQNPDGSYLLTGTQLNGISEGAGYGDDYRPSSNYPLVQLTDNSGNVMYLRSYNWSSTGVATGSTPETTNFSIPYTLPSGAYSLAVVANGIASNPVSFNVAGITGRALNDLTGSGILVPADTPIQGFKIELISTATGQIARDELTDAGWRLQFRTRRARDLPAKGDSSGWLQCDNDESSHHRCVHRRAVSCRFWKFQGLDTER